MEIVVCEYFSLFSQLSADPMISASMFVEAIILPWYLFLADKDGVERLPYALMDQLEERMHQEVEREDRR